jgi:hypothetical protein
MKDQALSILLNKNMKILNLNMKSSKKPEMSYKADMRRKKPYGKERLNSLRSKSNSSRETLLKAIRSLKHLFCSSRAKELEEIPTKSSWT